LIQLELPEVLAECLVVAVVAVVVAPTQRVAARVARVALGE